MLRRSRTGLTLFCFLLLQSLMSCFWLINPSRCSFIHLIHIVSLFSFCHPLLQSVIASQLVLAPPLFQTLSEALSTLSAIKKSNNNNNINNSNQNKSAYPDTTSGISGSQSSLEQPDWMAPEAPIMPGYDATARGACAHVTKYWWTREFILALTLKCRLVIRAAEASISIWVTFIVARLSILVGNLLNCPEVPFFSCRFTVSLHYYESRYGYRLLHRQYSHSGQCESRYILCCSTLSQHPGAGSIEGHLKDCCVVLHSCAVLYCCVVLHSCLCCFVLASALLSFSLLHTLSLSSSFSEIHCSSVFLFPLLLFFSRNADFIEVSPSELLKHGLLAPIQRRFVSMAPLLVRILVSEQGPLLR